jgi:hypothetical protein
MILFMLSIFAYSRLHYASLLHVYLYCKIGEGEREEGGGKDVGGTLRPQN